MSFATTDLCDQHEDRLASGQLRIVAPGLLHLGRRRKFAGEAVTLKVFEDNSLVRTALEEPGRCRVLAIDGGGSLRCALVGGNLGALAVRNGWSGIVVNGCVRDASELDACEFGVRALALHPRRSARRGAGERDVAIQLPGAPVRPGEFIYADADGILVSEGVLIDPGAS
jgi:regulator of ribonuclease activity A